VTSREAMAEILTPLVAEKEPIAAPGGDKVTVLVHADNATPDDYVILVLRTFFELSDELAEHIIWVAHAAGIAPVVTRPRYEAASLVHQADAYARLDGFPLTFSLEKGSRTPKKDYRKTAIQLVLYGLLSLLILAAVSLATADTAGDSAVQSLAPGAGARMIYEQRVTSPQGGFLKASTVTGISNSLYCKQM
jgi:ATP-dependent Clp protease adapter protein ClpS